MNHEKDSQRYQAFTDSLSSTQQRMNEQVERLRRFMKKGLFPNEKLQSELPPKAPKEDYSWE